MRNASHSNGWPSACQLLPEHTDTRKVEPTFERLLIGELNSVLLLERKNAHDLLFD